MLGPHYDEYPCAQALGWQGGKSAAIILCCAFFTSYGQRTISRVPWSSPRVRNKRSGLAGAPVPATFSKRRCTWRRAKNGADGYYGEAHEPGLDDESLLTDDTIEDSVDEGVRLIGAIGLGQFDGLVDGYPDRNLSDKEHFCQRQT